MEGIRTKSMFLTSKKAQYYLLIMDDEKSLDMDLFRELVWPAEFVWLQQIPTL